MGNSSLIIKYIKLLTNVKKMQLNLQVEQVTDKTQFIILIYFRIPLRDIQFYLTL